MPPKIPLTLDDARELLRAYHLSPRAITPLAGGTINANFRVDSDAGPLFLRVNHGKTDADIAFEVDLIWHLTSRGFPTPTLWRTRRGDAFVRLPADPRQQVMLMQWVHGEEHDEDHITDEQAGSVGALLGRFHRVAADFPGQRAGIYSLRAIRGRIEQLAREPRLPDGLIEHLEREASWLSDGRDASLPRGLGHSDLFPDNLFFAPGPRGAAAYIIDLEQAATIPLAYDVAVALLSFCAPPRDPAAGDPTRVGPLLLGRARALWQGYAAAAPPEAAALSPRSLLAELRFAALRFTVTRLTDVHLPRLRAPAPPLAAGRHSKDYRDMLRRLEALQALPPEALTSLTGRASDRPR